MHTIVEPSEIEASIMVLRGRISEEMHHKGTKDFAFPGGASGTGECYEKPTRYGLLSVIIPSEQGHSNRWMHFINLDQRGDVVASDSEINISKGLDRKIATLLVNDKGKVLRCNRGKFTVRKGSLGKSIVLKHFSDQYRNVIHIQDCDKPDSVIQISEINSSSLFDDIALFTHRVKALKQPYRNV